MRLARLALGLVVVLMTGLLAAPPASAGQSHGRDYRRVGYYTQWSLYSGFTPKLLADRGAAARLTHINYAFGNVSADGKCFIVNQVGVGDAWADFQRPYPAEESVDGVADTWDQPLAGNFGQLRKLKAKYPKLKVNISLGGWSWSKYFSDAALTKESRQAFVSSCIDLYLKGNLPALDGRGGPGSGAGVFDGIDLDWEWPASAGADGNVVRPEDKQNFTALVEEFRRQLDSYGKQAGRHFELTAFLPADPKKMDAGFEARRIFRAFDFATIQGYDFHGTWEARTNHQSAIREPRDAPVTPDFTLDRTVRSWLSRGAPRSKLVAGVPYYGQGWTGVGPANNGLFQPASGPATGSGNYRVLATLKDKGYTVYRDRRAGFAWLYNGTDFWTFDDPAVVAQKMLYVRANGLGGAMVWSLDGDDDNATLTKTIGAVLR